MLTFVRTHWSKISTGLLLATLVATGGVRIYEHFAGCCVPGSPCCYPGSPCCHGHQVAAL
jgi:uncharacterized protein (DUF779 family)